MIPVVARALEIARSQVGVREVGGQNRGADILKYQLSVPGGQPGDSYCAEFVYWCFHQAADGLGVSNPCPPSRSALALAKRCQVGYHVQEPVRGALFYVDHGHGLGHIGFVDEVHGDEILEISGNTNDSGSREGIGVFIRPRRRIAITAYIDFSRTLLPQATEPLAVA